MRQRFEFQRTNTSVQVSPKSFGINSWIPQMIKQWIPDSWSGDEKCRSPKGAAANSRNWQLMTSGRSQVLATSNFKDWHTVVGEIPWSSQTKTVMDCHSKLVSQSLRNNQPVQVILHQPRQTTLIFLGPIDQRCCSILNVLQLVRRLLWRERQNSYSSQRDVTKAWTNVLTDSMSSERRTRLSCPSQKKRVLHTFQTCLSRL